MPFDYQQIDDLEAELDALGDDPTSEEVLAKSKDYDAGIVAAVAVTRGGAAAPGGSQPYLDRAPAGDVTVPDKGCIVSIDYYEPTGTLTLDGDAVLEILT